MEHLNEQLDKKTELVRSLKEEVSLLKSSLKTANGKIVKLEKSREKLEEEIIVKGTVGEGNFDAAVYQVSVTHFSIHSGLGWEGLKWFGGWVDGEKFQHHIILFASPPLPEIAGLRPASDSSPKQPDRAEGWGYKTVSGGASEDEGGCQGSE